MGKFHSQIITFDLFFLYVMQIQQLNWPWRKYQLKIEPSLSTFTLKTMQAWESHKHLKVS